MNEQEGKFVQLLLEEATKVLVPILVLLLLALGKKAWAWLELQLGVTRANALKEAVRKAVYFAEASGAMAQWVKQGKQKEDLAVAIAQREADRLKIKVNIADLVNLVKTTVYEEFNFGRDYAAEEAEKAGTT